MYCYSVKIAPDFFLNLSVVRLVPAAHFFKFGLLYHVLLFCEDCPRFFQNLSVGRLPADHFLSKSRRFGIQVLDISLFALSAFVSLNVIFGCLNETPWIEYLINCPKRRVPTCKGGCTNDQPQPALASRPHTIGKRGLLRGMNGKGNAIRLLSLWHCNVVYSKPSVAL
jgi:hypothetical protein